VVRGGGQAESTRPDHLEGAVGLVVTEARWAVRVALLAGMASLTACSSGLGINGGGGQSSMPASIVVDFKVGVSAHQAIAEVKRCHPLSIMGTNTARSHGLSETGVFIWGPESGTPGSFALYKCLKAAPGEADQNWSG
jgi:hypothetical protein